MAAFFQRIIAFFMTVLAFFGIGKTDKKPEYQFVTQKDAYYVLEGQSVKFTFVSNPSTGYSWQIEQNGDSLVQTEDTFVQKAVNSPDGAAVAGAPGEQTYGYGAVKPGHVTLVFSYLRPWENEPPAEQFVAEITVSNDLTITVDSFVATK